MLSGEALFGDPAAAQISAVFNGLFAASHNTVLRGGADEPLYLPEESGRPAQIRFRHDYPSSALHEVAHWCIAGEERRGQVDYGYWYEPDGRSEAQQAAFLRVEARPQALECLFSQAAGVDFTLSLDNLSAAPDRASTQVFAAAVAHALRQYVEQEMPPRATQFFAALACGFSSDVTPATHKALAIDQAETWV